VSWRDRGRIHRTWRVGGVRSDSRFPTGIL
jgi:hypothetical protein